jgi:hypothetical protein
MTDSLSRVTAFHFLPANFPRSRGQPSLVTQYKSVRAEQPLKNSRAGLTRHRIAGTGSAPHANSLALYRCLVGAYSDSERQLLAGSTPATAHLGVRAMAACHGLNFTPCLSHSKPELQARQHPAMIPSRATGVISRLHSSNCGGSGVFRAQGTSVGGLRQRLLHAA